MVTPLDRNISIIGGVAQSQTALNLHNEARDSLELEELINHTYMITFDFQNIHYSEFS